MLRPLKTLAGRGAYAAVGRANFSPLLAPCTPHRSQLFGRLISQPVAFFDATETAQLTSRLAADCSVISRLFSTSINVAIRNSLQVVRAVFAACAACSSAPAAESTHMLLLLVADEWHLRSHAAPAACSVGCPAPAPSPCLHTISLLTSHLVFPLLRPADRRCLVPLAPVATDGRRHRRRGRRSGAGCWHLWLLYPPRPAHLSGRTGRLKRCGRGGVHPVPPGASLWHGRRYTAAVRCQPGDAAPHLHPPGARRLVWVWLFRSSPCML